MGNDPRNKDRVLGKFCGLLLPWWEGDVVNQVAGGELRKFIVYLVD